MTAELAAGRVTWEPVEGHRPLPVAPLAQAVDPSRHFPDAGIKQALLDTVATPDAAGVKLLADAAERMKLSARGYHRVLKVARTIADLAGSATVTKSHIAEALSYRRLTHLA